MAGKDFWQKKELLDLYMEGNQLVKADALCQELLAACQLAAGGKGQEAVLPDGWQEIQLELVQINAAIVIETGDMLRADEALARLSAAGEQPYSIFLQARIYWMQGRCFEMLSLLEEYFQVDSGRGEVFFAQDSSYWQVNADIKERILNLLAHGYKFYGLSQLACSCYLQSSRVVEDFPVRLLEYSNYLFNAHYLFMPPREYLQAHLGYGRLFDRYGNVRQLRHNKRLHQQHRKIRLGYLSPDFRQHVVLLFIWAMFTCYDRDAFEVYCFSNSPVEDKYTEYIKAHTDFWCNLSGMDAMQAAKVIYNKEIDILVELAGHSQNNGLPILAYKPAPVQMCGIGYFATTGLSSVDYFLSDRYLITDSCDSMSGESCVGSEEAGIAESDCFVEKLLVLPHSHFCYVPLAEMPDLQGAPCRKNGYITFGSFNNFTKVNDTVLCVWADILHRLPESRLLLKCSLLGDREGRELVRQKLLSLGISEERFELRGFSQPYLTEYYDIDIALDTFPYPGGGTTCDALYMGVPVITLGDGSHGGNFGISLLKNIGLDACCAASVEEYIEKAALLAGDMELLEALHLGIRNMLMASPVMDKAGYMQELQQGYRLIWQRYLAK